MTDNTDLPASVRGAMDLSQTTQPAPETSAVESGAPTWRYEVASEADFQKFVSMSAQGAVVLAFWSDHSPASAETVEVLQKIIDSAKGSLLLATVDINKFPEIAGAFQLQGVPAAVALVGGRPAPLYNGQVTEEQILDVLQQLLQIAAQQQLPGGFDPAPSAEAEKPLPPLHREAYDALEQGDYAGARTAYQKALSENPADHDAKVGLAQVNLLERLAGAKTDVRAQAAANPTDIEAAFAVADLDITGGHVEDAFARLINLFKAVPADQKTLVRERLLELFEVVGAQDPRVNKARADLMMALF